MNEWEKQEQERNALAMIEALREGREVALVYPGYDANIVNDLKESLGNLYRLTYDQEIRIASMTRNTNGVLCVIFARKNENE